MTPRDRDAVKAMLIKAAMLLMNGAPGDLATINKAIQAMGSNEDRETTSTDPLKK
jgi:hypothetical protein